MDYKTKFTRQATGDEISATIASFPTTLFHEIRTSRVNKHTRFVEVASSASDVVPSSEIEKCSSYRTFLANSGKYGNSLVGWEKLQVSCTLHFKGSKRILKNDLGNNVQRNKFKLSDCSTLFFFFDLSRS